MKPLLIALGGNALIKPHQLGNFKQQLENVTHACEGIAALAKKGTPVVVTHGNGPQVGNLELQMQAASPKIPSMPLDVEGAMTQGQIGHLLFLGLKKWAPKLDVSVVVTHVEVDTHDPAFGFPTKPIGPWYNEKQAEHLKGEGIPLYHDPVKGFRKKVASPEPRKTLELNTIQALLKEGHTVICTGGGGIPVAHTPIGWKGVEAVIDKDLSSQLLANELKSEKLVILTNEKHAYAGYYTKKAVPLPTLSLKEAQKYLFKGEFGQGSMEPKIKAGMRFIQKGGKDAYIGHTNELEKVLKHESGTRIRR